MSTSTGLRRRRTQLLACAGVGAVATLVGTASPAFAADGVMVRLEPTEVMLAALPIENFGGDLGGFYGPMGGSVDEVTAVGDFVLVPVQYGGTITVDVPDGLDASTATADLVFDDNEDGTPEAVYSSRFALANPKRLTITPSAGSVVVTLPADDPAIENAATLSIGRLTSTLGPAFSDVYDTIDYEIEFDDAMPPTAPAAQTVEPVLIASSQVPCDFSSYDRCPIPTPVLPGSPVTLALTQGSVLRELGLTDLTGVQVHLAALDEEGYGLYEETEVRVKVAGSQATFAMPADAEPGAYNLFITQPTPSGGASTVVTELTVEAPAAPAAVPATPESNPGLRSNTGVHLPEAGASDGAGGAAVATGAGILLMAGVGAATVVARSRRRPAAEGGTCGV